MFVKSLIIIDQPSFPKSHCQKISLLEKFLTLCCKIFNLSGYLIISVCKKFKWHRVALISTEGAQAWPVAEFLRNAIDSDENFYLAKEYRNVSQTASPERLREIFEDLRDIARSE